MGGKNSDKQLVEKRSGRHGRDRSNPYILSEGRQDHRDLLGHARDDGRTQPVHGRTSSHCSWPKISVRDEVSGYNDLNE
ncbi:hypothetical protein FocTR4_00016845 [Fusarium oxysporum f. sp. cubense]|uniref:Uncharacterized protein n=1 Tax=Fusarium oxysporum f. sp. cubense TaxID=61366 RepID=A0A5C6SIQ9_FUSOC|nr:hypothetical protein FocTR4_00016845 [Fusarium oxysporum f. sp. cubense]